MPGLGAMGRCWVTLLPLQMLLATDKVETC